MPAMAGRLLRKLRKLRATRLHQRIPAPTTRNQKRPTRKLRKAPQRRKPPKKLPPPKLQVVIKASGPQWQVDVSITIRPSVASPNRRETSSHNFKLQRQVCVVVGSLRFGY